jgi:hypothetical protein
MTLGVFLNNIVFGAFAGAVLGSAALMASKFTFVKDAGFYAGVIFAAFCVVGMIFTLFKVPSPKAAAAAGDALGYKERFITAMDILKEGAKNAGERMVADDALSVATARELCEKYKIYVPRKNAVALIAALAFMFVAAFAPPIRAVEIADARKINEKIERVAADIERDAKEFKKAVTDARAKEADERIKELLKALRRTSNEAEAVRLTQSTRAEIQKLANDTVSKDLKMLGDKLSAYQNTAALGEALTRGDMDGVNNAFNALAELLKRADEKQKREIAEIMAESARSLAENEELRNLLDEASQTLNRDGALDELGGYIENLAGENADLRDALNDLNDSVARSGGNLNGQPSGQQGQGQQGQGQQGQGQQGQGQQGQGQQGQGQQGQGPGQGSPGGNGRGSGHIENENVYFRGAADKNAVEANVTGITGEGGELTEQTVTGMGQRGESVPYGEVLDEVINSELKSVDDYDIPAGMKDLVRDYFLSLE